MDESHTTAMTDVLPDFPVISADSHVTEPGDTYTAFIDPAYRDRAPRLVRDPVLGDVFHIDGFVSLQPSRCGL